MGYRVWGIRYRVTEPSVSRERSSYPIPYTPYL
jgi:hypothetical protein